MDTESPVGCSPCELRGDGRHSMPNLPHESSCRAHSVRTGLCGLCISIPRIQHCHVSANSVSWRTGHLRNLGIGHLAIVPCKHKTRTSPILRCACPPLGTLFARLDLRPYVDRTLEDGTKHLNLISAMPKYTFSILKKMTDTSTLFLEAPT